jgi:hypothetical protein
MPVIPLYETPPNPNAWHRVIAPGGYESWSFVAENHDGIRIEINLFDGDPVNRAYQAAYARYRRRPTRGAPPVPRDYPALRSLVSVGGVAQWKQDLSWPAGAFEGSPSALKIGSCVVQLANAGAWRLTFETLAAELIFEPSDSIPPQLVKLDSSDAAISHFRISGPQRYDVRGNYRLPGAQVFAFQGEGHVVHLFGTGPPRY